MRAGYEKLMGRVTLLAFASLPWDFATLEDYIWDENQEKEDLNVRQL